MANPFFGFAVIYFVLQNVIFCLRQSDISDKADAEGMIVQTFEKFIIQYSGIGIKYILLVLVGTQSAFYIAVCSLSCCILTLIIELFTLA